MVGGEVGFQTMMPESYIHRRKKRRKEGRKMGWPVESVAVARTHSWSQKSTAGFSEHFYGQQSPHRPASPRRHGSGISLVARTSVSVGNIVELVTACCAGNGDQSLSSWAGLG